MKLRRIGTIHCDVGEGPLWDVLDQALYFVDVTAQLLWRYEPQGGNFTKWKMPSMIGSLALREEGGAIVALQDGFYRFDFHRNSTSPICNPQPDNRTQFNDGKVDRQGRFVAGTQSRAVCNPAPLGRLYHLDGRYGTRELDEGFGITNGPCWSPEGRTFYFSNSLEKTIFAYDYDPDTGAVSNRRVFAETASLGGMPDGATVDSSGCVWVAVCGGGKIVSYDPDGRTSRVVDVPVPFVSSVMFGGPELGQLYFTSIDGAAVGLTPQRDPLSGGLFVIDGLGVRGLSEPRFAG
jgi:sugar lactone lactonase YvrE